MTITTFDGVLAGAQKPQYFHFASNNSGAANKMFSHWANSGGNISNGKYDITTAGGVALSSSSGILDGQIPHFDPTGGNSAYIARFAVKSNPSATTMLADRLWHCGCTNTGVQLSVTSTAVQNVASVTWPARDDIGSTNGVGVQIGVEVAATLGAGVPVYTITGYDQAKTALSGAQNVATMAASAAGGVFHAIRASANSGSYGVSNVTTYQQSVSSTSGMIALVAYRPLIMLSPPVAGGLGTGDMLVGGFPKIANGVVPFILEFAFTSATRTLYGTYTESQG